jgi:hypothetical protein
MIARLPWRTVTVGVATVLLVVLSGCPTPVNRTPTASAGADQTVAGGSIVTLNGSGSSDPRGRTLTFQWQQTGGSPTVALTDANSAIATFTAPNQAASLTFQLTVNNGGGGTASDTTVVTVTAAGNQSPIANAGPDQAVTAGATVNLNGSGSSDPDGDPLTFQWQQTAGTPTVALSNANTAAASFTAPNQAATLTFQLTVSDGRGGTASDTTVVTITATPVSKPILYIANVGGDSITAYDLTTPATVNGNIPPNANLAGAQTLLSEPDALVIDNAGGLLVLNFANNSVTGYTNARSLGQINGNVAPIRNVQGAATLLARPASMTIDRVNDLLFVSDEIGGNVHVYAGASTAAFNGNLSPVRNITSADMNGPFGIQFVASGELYTANFKANTVAVFANASNLNGTVNASRIISSPAFSTPYGAFVDRNDTLYVVNSGQGGTLANQVNVFFNAATRNGAVMPDSTLIVPGATDLTVIAVSAAGTGYITDRGNTNAVFVYDNIATRNGTIAPDRLLQGANTLLAAPISVLVDE